jgi:hypothetical protein
VGSLQQYRYEVFQVPIEKTRQTTGSFNYRSRTTIAGRMLLAQDALRPLPSDDVTVSMILALPRSVTP